MSQNKTVFPGLGSEADFNPNPNTGSRGFQRAMPTRGQGTVCPGLDPSYPDESSRVRQSYQTPRKSGGNKPIVGFLYSISRTGTGEYWPLHIGQNIIGNSSDCDIILGEGTVSSHHANLHVNKMKKPEKIEAIISDLGSTNGTCVNENSVSLARPVECVNGDVITIGENYDLLVMLVDAKNIGLHVAEKFYDVREPIIEAAPVFTPPEARATRHEADFPPRFHGTSTPKSPYSPGPDRPNDSTIGLDPSSSTFKPGGTVGMDESASEEGRRSTKY